MQRSGRLVLLLVLACYFALLILLNGTSEFRLWQLQTVPTLAPGFADMRVVTAGWECSRLGYDPMDHNPCDPWGRPVNYPRIWMSVAGLGWSEDNTGLLSIFVAATFFLAVFLVIGPISAGEALLYAVILTSPAIMSGVERGNVDLLLFALISVAVLLLGRGAFAYFWACALLLLTAILKIYPILGASALLKQARNRALMGLGLVLPPYVLFLLLTADDLRLMSEGTPRPVFWAYGVGVAVDAGRHLLSRAFPETVEVLMHPAAGLFFRALAVAVAVALAAWVAGRFVLPAGGDAGDHDRELAFFWAGASIYLGTFVILGHNWDYRLLFVILAIPQMLRWLRAPRPLGSMTAFALVAFVAALWLSFFGSLLFLLDEIATWLLFVYLAAMLLRTFPLKLNVSAGARLGFSRKAEAVTVAGARSSPPRLT